MIAALVGWSVAHRRLVVATVLVLAAIGVRIALELEFDAMPDTTTNQVLVLTRAPGLTPEEVERLVTRPVETSLGGVPGLVEQRSLSRYGLSSVTAVFDDDVDPWRARQVVAERIGGLAASMPEGVEAPEIGPLTGGLGEVFHFTLSSPERTTAELLEIATFQASPLLRSVPGVVEVNTWGGAERTLDVVADPVRLSQRHLTLEDLRQGLERATGTAAGASVPAGSSQVLLRAVAQPLDPVALGAAIVSPGVDGAAPVRVADVARVRVGAAPRLGAATADGRGETVYVMVQMLRGANALDVTTLVEDRMTEVRKLLPADVRVDVVYDRALLVKRTLKTVFKNLGEGGLLVVIVLFAMLGSLRAGVLVAAAIPLSMLGAAAGMVALGIPGNLMSLGAIDFGLLVDGAVVMIETVFHRLGRREDERPDADASLPWPARVGRVSRQVAGPVFFSVLVIVLVYIPVLSLQGVDGRMFRPMAATVVLALTTSLVLSLTFIPAGAALWLRPKDIPARDPLLVRAVHRAYPPVLEAATSHRALVAVGVVAVLVVGVVLFLRLGTELVPQLDEGDLVVQTTRAPDIRLEEAIRKAGEFERAALTVPEVQQVVSRIGSPAVATDIMGLEQADVFIALAPREQWRPGLTRNALVEELAEVFEKQAPGADPSFTQPIQMRFNELLGGAVTDVAVSVYGEDLAALRRGADQVAKAIRQVPGAHDVRVLAPPDVPLLEVRPRPLDAAMTGLSAGEVLDAVKAVRAGVEVGAVFDGPVRVPIMLRIAGGEDAWTLGQLSVPVPGGGAVPLSRVADVKLSNTAGLVSRQDAQRRLVVGFNVRGADLGTVVEQAQAAVDASGALPEGTRLAWGGQFEQLEEAMARLKVVVPLVLVLIVGVLVLAFRQLRAALVLLAHVPFAGVGGVVLLTARGMPLSMSAAVGFIALSGIAVLNGVVLVSRLLEAEREGVDAVEAARLSALSRVRPVLMTALVAALGFVPMMLATGAGAEVQRPLATVVVGGLVSSTLLTLVVLPSLWPWASGQTRKKPQPAG